MNYVSRQTEDEVDHRGVNFFRSLTPAERQAFASVAVERSFASGSRVMSEGEPANHVMVIVSGWIRITARRQGSERTVAERGPGQLVGERAALRSTIRSATVTALTAVSALVMRTEDFASFISAHPRVLVVVEDQIWTRLAEDPKGYGLEGLAGAQTPPAPVRPAPDAGRRQAPVLSGENCTILLTDVVGFGARHRTDWDRLIIRREHLEMLRESLGDLWEAGRWEDRGDGLLVVLPPQVPTGKVVERIHRELPPRLRRHNRTFAEGAQFQLRVAANVGPVTTDGIGMSGDAIIRTSRLAEAPVLKAAMSPASYSLGIIVSEFVHDNALGQLDDFIDINEYRKVEVRLKEFESSAWMWLTDISPPARDSANNTDAGLRAAGEWYRPAH